MTTQTYVLCAIAGVLGILLHVFAIKLPSAQKRAKAANIKFTAGDFLSTESAGIISSFIAVGMILITVGELLNYKPEFSKYIITIFAFVGFTGSTIILAAFNKVGSLINKVVDIKTDGFDNKISPQQAEEKLSQLPQSKITDNKTLQETQEPALPYPNQG